MNGGKIGVCIRRHLARHTGIIVKGYCMGLREALGLAAGEKVAEWLFVSSERKNSCVSKPYGLRFVELSKRDALTLINDYGLQPVYENSHGTVYDADGEPFRKRYAGTVYTNGL